MKCLLSVLLFFVCQQYVSAQGPVYEEPRHKVALQNEYIRLIDVNIPAHDTTQYHRHSTPSAIVFLSKSVTGSQPMGGQMNTGGHVNPGYSVYADFAEKPVTHRVWNEDSSNYHVMDIEIFPRQSFNSCQPITTAMCKLAWAEKNVRVYNIHVESGKKIDIKKSICPHLLILISGAVKTNSEKQINAGGFLWYPTGSDVKIENKNSGDAECVMLELI